MQLAFDEFKDRFHNSPDQLSQDQRCSKKRSRLNAYFKQVFGHNNGIWDYWETGEMLPLSPDIPPLPLHEREELASVASVRRVHSDSQVARLRSASEVQQAEQRRHQARCAL